MEKLRLKKKQRCELRILEVAFELFVTKGYAETSMHEIAEGAEVAVGTLYNYFKAKSDILFAYLLNQNRNLIDIGNQVLANPGTDPLEAVLKLFTVYTEAFTPFSKPLWRQFLAAAYSDSKTPNKGLWDSTVGFPEQLQKLLVQLQQKGLISSETDPGNSAAALYSIFFMQFLRFINTDITLDSFFSALRAQLEIVFTGLYQPNKN